MTTKELIKSEIEDYAKFDIIRYSQVWEDAEILIEALEINNTDNILSIAPCFISSNLFCAWIPIKFPNFS